MTRAERLCELRYPEGDYAKACQMIARITFVPVRNSVRGAEEALFRHRITSMLNEHGKAKPSGL